ncbi:uncharacterized protein P174DRAFT_146658 [Aspergillus novofumigatus IBT 16806]|uniref:Secreted protein n=1 Tax=Aspergillus novofumigatus (strain IBT 16806) TaxID=1392255 RepID=A0A2I1CDX6_ASPN1|nr:uncharacterized protein P174DRAFT_146658 [Aspergillus novofumigatus IBT 16806]PKX95830.1 hypothetical protein P174DRAFT_146658 [Aspergillus novofumigatus IBT 16806]
MRRCLLIILLSGGADSGTPSKQILINRRHCSIEFHRLHHLNGGPSHCRISDIATEDLIHLAILGLEERRALVERERSKPRLKRRPRLPN